VPAVAGDAEALLQRARAADGASPEPLQALASLRYELGQPEEALGLLRQSMARWCTPERGSDSASDGDGWEEASDADAAHAMQQDDAAVAGAAAGADADGGFVIPKKPVTMSEAGDEAEPEPMPADGGGPDCAAELDDGDDDESDALPSYEFRFECAKLLLELDEDTDTAVGVLEDLLAENDAVLDVWHLLGLAYYSGGSLQEAAEVCAAGLARMQQQGVPPDEGIALAFDDLQSAIAEAQQQDGERDAAD
jgi:kinesin family protein 5